MNRQQADPDLSAFADQLTRHASVNRHRLAILLSGSRNWGQEFARILLQSYNPDQVLRLPAGDPDTTPASLLGREFDAAVWDCHCDIDPDAIGIAGGTIRAGGLMVFLVPTLEDWSNQEVPALRKILAHGCNTPERSNYLARFASIAATSKKHVLVREGQPLPLFGHPSRDIYPSPDFSDQEQAIDCVCRVVQGQRRKPALLVSDRGRGKSAALGLAARALLDSGLENIAVTGASRRSIDCVFKHAGTAYVDSGRIRFYPADRLVRDNVRADLLLVDEAASIPLPMLVRLLQDYPRIAFASTVHGYEGTGRGFTLRFRSLLDQYARGFRLCELRSPIRWAPGDPLEEFLFEILLLDAEPADPGTILADPAIAKCRILDTASLATDEPLLRNTFGLLVQAHYRTRPFDLWHLLDGCNQSIFSLHAGSRLAAVAVVVTEGGFTADIDEKVRHNLTRPQGHLLPELLSSQLGIQGACTLRYARIVRIVVDPEFQGQGLGTRLVREICAGMEGQVDAVGTTFGIDSRLLSFWTRCDFTPVRVGSTRGLSSGAFPVCLIHPLSPMGRDLTADASQRFTDNFGLQLGASLESLDPATIPTLFRAAGHDRTVTTPDENQLETVQRFARHNGSLHDSMAMLSQFTQGYMMRPAAELCDADTLCFIAEKIFQHKKWKDCQYLPKPHGKKQGLRALRQAISQLLGDDLTDQ